MFQLSFCPILLQTILRWATVTGSSLSHFALQNAPHTFSIGDRWDCRQASQVPVPFFPPQPGLCNVCKCGLHCLVEICMDGPWKRCLLEGSILCSKISMYFSALMVPSQKCKFTFAKGTDTPHTMTDPGFGLVAGNSLDDPFLLWSGAHSVHSSQKIPEILIHLTTVQHVSTV